MRTAYGSILSRALISLHVLVLVHRAHAAVDGRAGRSPVLLLGGGDVDVGTLTRCRLEAHESVFDSETLADLDRAAPGAGDAPPDMCARPQLACRVASVASRCRLARGGARSRGACDVARDCERCVLDALGRDREAKTNEDPHPRRTRAFHPVASPPSSPNANTRGSIARWSGASINKNSPRWTPSVDT